MRGAPTHICGFHTTPTPDLELANLRGLKFVLWSRVVIGSWLDVAVDGGRVVLGSNPYLFRGGSTTVAAALLLAMLPRGRTGGAIGRGGA